MSRNRRYWILVIIVGLLLSLVTLVVIRAPRTVPLSQCSEVYRQFRHQPGVRAAFIKDMPINDTLRLDMTLFEAEDSAAFTDLMYALGKNDEGVRDMIMLGEMFRDKEDGVNVRFTGDWKWDEGGFQEISYFPVRRCVAIFHPKTEEEADIVFHKSIYDEIDIDQQQ